MRFPANLAVFRKIVKQTFPNFRKGSFFLAQTNELSDKQTFQLGSSLNISNLIIFSTSCRI